MEVVENILEVVTKMETIQEFYEFFEDIHNSAQCPDKKCRKRRFLLTL